MPYRIDAHAADSGAIDRLIDLGAIDLEHAGDGTLSAIMPDHVSPDDVGTAIGASTLRVSPAVARDDGSVWVLRPRPFRVGAIEIVQREGGLHTSPRNEEGTIELVDGDAFGTGRHPTTVLCLEAIEDIAHSQRPSAILDVGTGSGVLALAALLLGVPRASAIDLDETAVSAAADNARMNRLSTRIALRQGSIEIVSGVFPLVVANILAAALIEMAPALVRRVGPRGHLILSGFPASMSDEIARPYRRAGMHLIQARSRAGWGAIVLQASW